MWLLLNQSSVPASYVYIQEVPFLIGSKYSCIRTYPFHQFSQYILLYGQVSDIYDIATLNLTKNHPAEASINSGWRASRSSVQAIMKNVGEYFSPQQQISVCQSSEIRVIQL